MICEELLNRTREELLMGREELLERTREELLTEREELLNRTREELLTGREELLNRTREELLERELELLNWFGSSQTMHTALSLLPQPKIAMATSVANTSCTLIVLLPKDILGII